jgi:hypothetical protein
MQPTLIGLDAGSAFSAAARAALPALRTDATTATPTH